MKKSLPVGAFALAFTIAAQADTTLDYEILIGGKKAGSQKTIINEDGRVRVTFSFRDNGRGPDMVEDYAVLPDGSLASYRLRGTTMFGAVLDEQFEASGSTAKWRSPSERGEQTPAGPVFYLPTNYTPEISAAIVRATQQAGGRLAALPGGELRSEKLLMTRIGPRGREREVALYAILGGDLRPGYIWLESGGDKQLFALVEPAIAQLVIPGYEGAVEQLERLQQEAEARYLADIANRHTQTLPQPILIRNVRVFDAKYKRLGEPTDVYVNDGRIAAINPVGSPAKDPATVIDGAGRALLPGLFDMHAHEDAWNAALQIAGGITSSRDMGSNNEVLAKLEADIVAGRVVGPHIEPAGFVEGESANSNKRYGLSVNSIDEAKAAVDWYAERGFRQIKLYNSINPAWVGPIATHARSKGLRVSGHVPAFSRAERVVREGYDELQHINQLMLNFVSDQDTDSRTNIRFELVGQRAKDLDLESSEVRDFIALLAERQTVIDSTLATFEGYYTQEPGSMRPSIIAIAEHLPFATQRVWRTNETDVGGGKLEVYRESWHRMMEFMGRLYAAGVPLVAGTDDLAGFMLHRELELYVQAGVPPGEAVRIATENGARYSGVLADRGTIERGKRADLILVDGDPTKNISDIRRISYVLKDGVGYAPAELYEEFGIRRFVDPPTITR